jgi:hypothetical protein
VTCAGVRVRMRALCRAASQRAHLFAVVVILVLALAVAVVGVVVVVIVPLWWRVCVCFGGRGSSFMCQVETHEQCTSTTAGPTAPLTDAQVTHARTLR